MTSKKKTEKISYEWTPVAVASPKRGKYLCIITCGEKVDVIPLKYEKETWITSSFDVFATHTPFSVLAWMPLPKKYQSAEDGDIRKLRAFILPENPGQPATMITLGDVLGED